MKRLFSWIIIAAVLFSLTACSKSSPAQETAPSAEVAENKPASSDVLTETGAFLHSAVENPTFGSVGGEWLILGLARSGQDVSGEYFETYFQNLASYTAQQGGILNDRKYTDYSRVILAVTAIGKDPANVAGFNLLVPLADFEQTVFQGINGPIFALIALDSGKYEIPENVADSTQATRDLYLNYILNAQLEDGGWALMGSQAEIDMTAMALQALSKYRDRKEVADAVEKGVALLSDRQNEAGGYGDGDGENSESVAQTIVALTELGIAVNDSRFVKNGHTLMDGLLQFRQADGGFSHLKDTESDLLATEQAFYAMVAAKRLEEGKTSLYDMSDVG